jgi:hypothetical protein
MLGSQNRWQEDLFVAGPLSSLIPQDHILKQVDKILDLSWLRNEVRDLYDAYQGRPSIDPEAAVRLMLAGFFQQHGLRRAARRGLANVVIQAYLTAAVINLKRLVVFYLQFWGKIYPSDDLPWLLVRLYLQILYYFNNCRRNYLLAQ